MVGLDIKIPDGVGQYIFKLLEEIDFVSYTWTIQSEDAIRYENHDWNFNEKIFSKECMDGNEFLQSINRGSYYMIFVDIHAYPMEKEKYAIETYQDFLDSDCELVFLCADSIYVEIYCKHEEILQQIIKNCEKNQFEVKEISLQDVQSRTLRA